LGFRVQGSWCRVQGLGFRVEGVGWRVLSGRETTAACSASTRSSSTFFFFVLSSLELRIHKSMSLKYEPSSESLRRRRLASTRYPFRLNLTGLEGVELDARAGIWPSGVPLLEK